MTTGKFNIDLVQLEDINVISATLENNSGLKSIDHALYEIAFQYMLAPGISVRSKQIRVLADFDIRVAKSSVPESIITCKYGITFLFSVKNLEELVKIDHNDIEVDEELLSSVLNITYSTSRGILYTRHLGTILDGLILPIIPTADLYRSGVKAIPGKKA
jgi:hypothetical protein